MCNASTQSFVQRRLPVEAVGTVVWLDAAFVIVSFDFHSEPFFDSVSLAGVHTPLQRHIPCELGR